MHSDLIPKIPKEDMLYFYNEAEHSIRRRYNHILHKKGDYLNRVFNFLYQDSYMQPHLHTGPERMEKMYLIEGSFALITFNNNGAINKITTLSIGERDYIEVPPKTWHTYVMLTEKAAIYETMEGVYDPQTWKELADWAPSENSEKANNYFLHLMKNVTEHIS